MVDITNPEDIENAFFTYHTKLSSLIKNKIILKKVTTIIEIGSGPGTFTIPFISEIKNNFRKYYCIDPYYGSLNGNLDLLERKIYQHELTDRIEIIRKDARELPNLFSNINLIIGHAVLCVLNKNQLKEVISACYRVLKQGGLFIHSEPSPFTLNKSEELLYKLNEYANISIPDDMLYPPTGDRLAGIAYSIGFKSVCIEYTKIPLRFIGNAAIELIKSWDVKPEFLDKYGNEVLEVGIEFPMEQILICSK
jgi:SAM-dependent methyltransferase